MLTKLLQMRKMLLERKKKLAEQLCNIGSLILQWILDILITDDEKHNVAEKQFKHKDAENLMD